MAFVKKTKDHRTVNSVLVSRFNVLQKPFDDISFACRHFLRAAIDEIYDLYEILSCVSVKVIFMTKI